MLFICGGLFVLAAVCLWTWQQTRTEAITSLHVVAQFVSDNAQAVFEELGNDLPYLSLQLRDRSNTPASDYQLLKTYQTFHPAVASMVLFTPGGKMLLNTAVPFGSRLPDPRKIRSVFTSLKKTLQSHTQWVGQTQIGLILHHWRIPVRFVVRNDQGQPLYILQASVKLGYITSAWAHIALPEQTAVGLLRIDGYHVARLPARNRARIYSTRVDGALIQKLHRHPHSTQGTYLGRVQTDHTYRLGSYVRLDGYPIVAYASRANSEIVANWTKQILPFVAVGVLSIIGFLGFAYLLVKRENRHAVELTVQSRRHSLTGLPNRFGAQEWIESQLEDGASILTALEMDIINFKDINTALGTEVGDQVLQEIARRLCAHIGQINGIICHLDADKFLLILRGTGLINAHSRARSLRHIINSRLDAGTRSLHLQARIGIANLPDHAQSAVGLLRAAEAAVHAAKSAHSDISFYDSTSESISDARVNFQHAIERAFQNDEFKLHYQPIINLQSGQLAGAEGLIRWDDCERGLLLPDKFIPIAESTGWIAPLGEWVFRQACQDLRNWREKGLAIYISVNLSASQFNSPELITYLENEIDAAGINARNIILEITETTAMQDVLRSADIMRKISRLGLNLAIDDFGTGYSSLAYLRKFPVQTIKIDKSFITDIEHDPESLKIVKAIVALGQAIGKKTVAEGIENHAQYQLLKELGVDMGQGFFFSASLPGDDFILLSSKAREHPEQWIKNNGQVT